MIDFQGLTIPFNLIKALAIIIGSIIIYNLIRKSVGHTLKSKLITKDKRKYNTIKSLLDNIVKYILYTVLFIYTLSLFGVDSTTIGASLGAIGIVIGLSLQDLLKDIIAGIFIILENQYAVGDIVTIGTYTGKVNAIGLRMTKIEAETGEIKTISNRNILEVINYSLNDSTAIVDVKLAYDNDVTVVDQFFEDLLIHLKETVPNVKGDFRYLGIQSIDDQITYRIQVETAPMKRKRIESAILKEFIKELDKTKLKRK